MNTPLISVIVPVYNAATLLVSALDSIAAQKDLALEIIVVNDGSTDDSHAVARKWAENIPANQLNFQLFDQINSGPGQARNNGIEAANGEYIAFLDADDLWAPDSLKIRLDKLIEGQSDAVLGLTQTFTAPDPQNPAELNFVGESFVFMNVGSGLFKSQAFNAIGGFSPNMKGSEDVDWFFRARDNRLKLHTLNEVTLLHRRHENNLTKGQSLENLDFHLALKRSLDRRRAAKAMQTAAPFVQKDSTN